MPMKGLTWSTLKKEPALIPLFAIIGLACTGCAFYCVRLLTRNPDVQWYGRGERLSNQDYANKQYKFWTHSIDYSKIENKAPKYE